MLLPPALMLLTHRRLPPPLPITMDAPWWNLWAEEPASPQVAATISGPEPEPEHEPEPYR